MIINREKEEIPREDPIDSEEDNESWRKSHSPFLWDIPWNIRRQQWLNSLKKTDCDIHSFLWWLTVLNSREFFLLFAHYFVVEITSASFYIYEKQTGFILCWFSRVECCWISFCSHSLSSVCVQDASSLSQLRLYTQSFLWWLRTHLRFSLPCLDNFCMSFHVEWEVIRPGESSLTKSTLKGSISRMFPKVSSQFVRSRKLPSTSLPTALIGLFSCVSPEMGLQMRTLGVCFVAGRIRTGV